MKLIIGGPCHGKRQYARERFGAEAFAECDEHSYIEFSKYMANIENFALYCVRNNLEARDELERSKELWANSVILATDMSQGLVPMERELRDWREMTGRMLVYLSQKADEVVRLYYGIPSVLSRTVNITLMRHGTTEGNERKLYYGTTDLPLSAAGREELLRRRREYAYPKAEYYFTSGKRRANETLELIYGDVPHGELPSLSEMDFGDFEMHSYEELKDNSEYIRWIEDKTYSVSCPNGESFVTFNHRIAPALKKLLSEAEADTVLVCHGGVIGHGMGLLFPNEGKNYFDWIVQPGDAYTLRVKNGRATSYSPLEKAESSAE